MVWPSIFLILALVAFSLAVVAALILQFSRNSHPTWGYAVAAGIVLGIISVGTHLGLSPTAPVKEIRG